MFGGVLRSGIVRIFIFGLFAVLLCGIGGAQAQAVKVEGSLVAKEQIKLEFKDGTGHLFTMNLREGQLEGTGPFAKTKAQAYGVHDIYPGIGGAPTGYIVLTKSEKDIAYIKWNTQTAFIKGSDGKVSAVNNGNWNLISGLGAFQGLKGKGTIKITFGKDDDRVFTIEGTLTK